MYHKEHTLSHIQKSEDPSRKLARPEADQEPEPPGSSAAGVRARTMVTAMVTVTMGTAADSPR